MVKNPNFKIIVTVGPSILNDRLLRIDSLGPCIYRINGAHVDSESAELIIDQINNTISEPDIMMDLPGNKIRVNKEISFVSGNTFKIFSSDLNYSEFIPLLSNGDIVYANDSNQMFKIVSVGSDFISLEPSLSGRIEKNRGLHISGKNDKLPFLFDKDLSLINTAIKKKIKYISLSYVRSGEDIKQVKKILKGKDDINIIAKVETSSAVNNLDSILDEVGIINVDRGDLSSEVGILNIAKNQSKIVTIAMNRNKTIYLATQFLKNMEVNPTPLISEILSLSHSIDMGINGIQLSEETAIGRYPTQCVKLVFDIYKKSFSSG